MSAGLLEENNTVATKTRAAKPSPKRTRRNYAVELGELESRVAMARMIAAKIDKSPMVDLLLEILSGN